MFEGKPRRGVALDLINLVLGLVLLIAPWLLGFVSDVATLNAAMCGAVITLVALEALIAFVEWEEWINLAVGLWVAASPWLLGFGAEMRIHVIVGVLVAAIAATELWLVHRAPASVSAPNLGK